MKKILVFSVMLCVMKICYSQTMLRNLSRNVVAVEFYDSISKRNQIQHYIATGTFVLFTYDGAQKYLLLITNKHALPKINQATTVYIKMNHFHDSVNTSPLIISLPIFMEDYKPNPEIQYAKDDIDVAVINMSGALNNRDQDEVIKYALRNSEFATKDTCIKYMISTGREIVFVGYPNFFYNKNNIEPIVRRGIIATDPLVDFYFSDDLILMALKKGEYLPEKINGFLIDANAIGGSSGSLVFTTPQPFPLIQGSVSIPALTKYMITGILTYSYFDTFPKNSERINLGGVISSEIILNTMHELCSRLVKMRN